MRLLLLSFVLLSTTIGLAQQIDLTAGEWGPMPTALAAVPDMAYRPFFVTDDKADTGWVAPIPPVSPLSSDLTHNRVWLRLEWQFPVTISQVTFTQFTGSPFTDLKPISGYALQAERYFPPDWRGQWNDLEGAMGEAQPLDQPTTIVLKQPIRTRAIRLLLRGEANQKIGLSAAPPVLPPVDGPLGLGRALVADRPSRAHPPLPAPRVRSCRSGADQGGLAAGDSAGPVHDVGQRSRGPA
jgi:hypothetical protein